MTDNDQSMSMVERAGKAAADEYVRWEIRDARWLNLGVQVGAATDECGVYENIHTFSSLDEAIAEFAGIRAKFTGRAAISAMREPTDKDFGGEFGTEPRALFTRMIDAALTESK